jgi:hypothetical protein
MTREGEDTKFYNVENDIYGGMEHDQIQFVEFIGADFVDDEFIVDMSAGSLVVPGGIHVSGGDGGNDIATIIGDAGSDFLYTPSATTFGSGDVIGRVDSFFLTFEGLEPVYVSASVTGNVGMEPSNTDDVIAIATLARLPQFA